MPTKFIISKHTKNDTKGDDPFASLCVRNRASASRAGSHRDGILRQV